MKRAPRREVAPGVMYMHADEAGDPEVRTRFNDALAELPPNTTERIE